MTSFEISLLSAAECVAPEIVDLFARAQAHSLKSLREIKSYPLRRSMGPLILRTHLCELLDGRRSLDTAGWEVHTDPLHMASIRFSNTELDASFRLLKERDTYPGGVPTAVRGSSRAIDWNPGLFDADYSHTLLCTFDIHGIESHEHWETPIRFVRALEAPKYGRPVPIDLSVPLVAEPGFYAGRTFDTREQSNDLFATIQREENESN